VAFIDQPDRRGHVVDGRATAFGDRRGYQMDPGNVREALRECEQDIAEGVTWRDPERVSEWMGELSKEKPVVVYCAYGFHVGCRTAIALRDAGFDARYMTVGHSGWKAVGAPVKMNT